MNGIIRIGSAKDLLGLALLHLVLLGVLWTSLDGRVSQNENYDYFCCYEPSARNLIEGRGFIYNNGRFADMYPPGYPLVVSLALLAGKLVGVEAAHKALAAIFGILTVLLVYSAVRRLGSRQWALAAGGLAASYPFLLWMGKQPNSETPFIPATAAAFYCFTRIWTSATPMRWALATGLCTGLACMFRSIGLFSILAFAAAIVLAGRPFSFTRRAVLAATMLAANVLAIMPWEWILVNNGGFALLGRNAGSGYLDGLTFGIQHPESGEPIDISPELYGFMERAQEQADSVRTGKGFGDFLKAEYARDPGTVGEWLWLKVRRVWYANHTRRMESASAAIQAVYLGLAAMGLWVLRRAHPAVVWMLVLIVLYFWAMAVIVMPLMRYVVPVMILLMIPVSAALITIWNRLRPANALTSAFDAQTAPPQG